MGEPKISGSKQPISIQNSFFESHTPKYGFGSTTYRDNFENMEQLKTHKGPLNISAMTMRDPNAVIDDICEVLTRFSIVFVKLGPFKISIEHSKLKLMIEINSVEKFSNLFVIKFYKNNQHDTHYFDLCSNIFAMLNL